jgi:hypothetical protein
MSRNLFNRIAETILQHDYDGYFTQKRSASGVLGLHPLQKITAAMRMLTSGVLEFFGLPGSNNDLNVLQCSHVFAKLACSPIGL